MVVSTQRNLWARLSTQWLACINFFRDTQVYSFDESSWFFFFFFSSKRQEQAQKMPPHTVHGLHSRTTAQEEEVSVLAELRSFPPLREEDVDELLKTCGRRGLYDHLILMAVRYGRIDRLLSFETFILNPEISRHLLQGRLLVRLAAEGLSLPWDSVVASYSEYERCELIQWLSWNSVNSEVLSLFQMLLCHLAVGSLLCEMTGQRATYRLPCLQYERVVTVLDDLVRNIGDDYARLRRGIIFWVLDTNLRERLTPMTFSNAINDCLVLTCEQGLFSAPCGRAERSSFAEQFDPQNAKEEEAFRKISLIGRAVMYNQPDIVRFLYSTGTVSNREVFQLSRDPGLFEKCCREVTTADSDLEDFPSQHDVHAAREIRSFLVATASEPRSLKSLCLAEVSKGLGWGNARRAAVEKMKIPTIFKNDLMTNCDKSLLRYAVRF